jgi:hypothetical protein
MVILREAKRSRRIYWRTIELSFCAKQCESQNLIVILRGVKRNRRIYCRTRDGFCNSGRIRPPCRMTRSMADNEFKNPRFCQIHQLPIIFKFSHERSLLTPYSERSKVAKTNCHSARSEVESQKLSFIKTSTQFTKKCTPSAQFPA